MGPIHTLRVAKRTFFLESKCSAAFSRRRCPPVQAGSPASKLLRYRNHEGQVERARSVRAASSPLRARLLSSYSSAQLWPRDSAGGESPSRSLNTRLLLPKQTVRGRRKMHIEGRGFRM